VEETGANRCHTATTRIWVKLPVLPTTGALIYVYYGHTAAASLSSGSDVFDFFDSFSTLNPSVWQTAGEPIATASALALQAGATLVSQNPVLTDGVGRLITAFKQASLTLAGAKIGFSNTPSPTDHSHTDQAATIILGSTAETLAAYGGNNLISHHELEETTTTQAHQFKASGFFDTGKLNQALSIYGNEAGTEGSTLTFRRGNQISGDNYENYNFNQGTISLWFKPDWSGNPTTTKALFSAYGKSLITINSWGVIGAVYWDGTVNRGVSISGINWQSDTWYHVVLRWNGVNPVAGSQHIALTVNAVNSTNGYSAPFNTSSGPHQIFIGRSHPFTPNLHNADGLIDDLAIFDRILTDDEITQLYNSGTGQVAGIVADSSLKFYTNLDGTGTLAPVTSNFGTSWNMNANLLADHNMEAADLSNWTAFGNPRSFSKASTSNGTGGFDAQVLYIEADSSTNGVRQLTTLDPNKTYTLSFWYKHVNGQLRIFPWNGVGFSATLCTNEGGTVGWRYNECVFQPSSTSSGIAFAAQSNTADYYVDNVAIVENLAHNGGMEGEYVDGVAPGWTIMGSPTVSENTTQVHSGTKAQSISGSNGTAANSVNQSITWVPGNYYLVSAWGRITAGTGNATIFVWDGSANRALTFSSSAYARKSVIIKATGTSGHLRAFTNTGVTLVFDDVSVIPLANVTGSFQAWTPVSRFSW
jgi:hypothetical protein